MFQSNWLRKNTRVIFNRNKISRSKYSEFLILDNFTKDLRALKRYGNIHKRSEKFCDINIDIKKKALFGQMIHIRSYYNQPTAKLLFGLTLNFDNRK